MALWLYQRLGGSIRNAAFASVAAAGMAAALPVSAAEGETCCGALNEISARIEAAQSDGRLLRIYGQINRAVMFWDDGRGRRAYFVDNETSSSRIGAAGDVAVDGDVKVGYRVEFDLRPTLSSLVSNGDRRGDLDEGALRVRQANVYVEDARFGRITGGQQSPATDDITLINLGSQMSDAALHYNTGFQIRPPVPTVFNLTWEDLAHTVDTKRGLFVRYDTPTINGFLFSVSAGEEEVVDAALRYAAANAAFQFAGGIGFYRNGENDVSDVRGSASLLHLPTGLFTSLAGGIREDDGATIKVDSTGTFFFAQGGLKARPFSFGATTIYGEYAQYDDFSVGRIFEARLTGLPPDRRWALTSTDVDRWGVGIEQMFDARKLLIYAQYHHYEAAFSGARCAQLAGPACTLDGTRRSFTSDPWQAVVVGARLPF